MTRGGYRPVRLMVSHVMGQARNSRHAITLSASGILLSPSVRVSQDSSLIPGRLKGRLSRSSWRASVTLRGVPKSVVIETSQPTGLKDEDRRREESHRTSANGPGLMSPMDGSPEHRDHAMLRRAPDSLERGEPG